MPDDYHIWFTDPFGEERKLILTFCRIENALEEFRAHYGTDSKIRKILVEASTKKSK